MPQLQRSQRTPRRLPVSWSWSLTRRRSLDPRPQIAQTSEGAMQVPYLLRCHAAPLHGLHRLCRPSLLDRLTENSFTGLAVLQEEHRLVPGGDGGCLLTTTIGVSNGLGGHVFLLIDEDHSLGIADPQVCRKRGMGVSN